MFTINNPTNRDEGILLRYMNQPTARAAARIRYIVWTEEEATTRHFQGYVEFTAAKRLTAVQKILGGRAHLEPRKGTQKEAIAYVKKQDDTLVVNGVHGEGGQAAKQLGDDLIDAVMGGATVSEIMRQFPKEYIRNHGGIDKIISDQVKPRHHKMEIIILYGKTGSGKSWTANRLYPTAYHCAWPTGGRWGWSKYEGEETVPLVLPRSLVLL